MFASQEPEVANSFVPQYDYYYTSLSQQKTSTIIVVLRLASLRWTGDYRSSHCTRVRPICS